MKLNFDTLAMRPATQAVGLLLAGPLANAIGRFLPGIAGTAGVIAAGYMAASSQGIVGRVGQGVLAGTAAGLLSPFLTPMFNVLQPTPGSV